MTHSLSETAAPMPPAEPPRDSAFRFLAETYTVPRAAARTSTNRRFRGATPDPSFRAESRAVAGPGRFAPGLPGWALEMPSTAGVPTLLGRRAFLQGSLAVLTGLILGGSMTSCSEPPHHRQDATPTVAPAPPTARSPKVLLAYFSRAGENYYYGGRTRLQVGNTQVVADLIREFLDCDVYRIEARDPYPSDYDATAARNVQEQNTDARPAIANPLAAIASYSTVLLGSPIWNVRPPDDHVELCGGLQLRGENGLPVHNLCDEWPGDDSAGVRRGLPGRDDRRGTGGTGRGGQQG